MVTKIVLTGGPCAGKTTVLAAIKAQFGRKVVIAHEAATNLFSRGYPQPGRDCDWSPAWQRTFQGQVLATQWMIEVWAAVEADLQQATLIIFDRGVPDGAAYWPDGVEDFFRAKKMDRDHEHYRYHQVLHLESLACRQPESYGRQGNQHRYEDAQQASELDHRTRQAWHGHPNWQLIPCQGSINHKIQVVIAALQSHL